MGRSRYGGRQNTAETGDNRFDLLPLLCAVRKRVGQFELFDFQFRYSFKKRRDRAFRRCLLIVFLPRKNGGLKTLAFQVFESLHHIQDCITDASGSSSAASNVSVRPRRVQLRRHSAATLFHNHQSCRRSTNQDSVRTAGLRCLWSRHLERSSPSYLHHRLLLAFRRSLKTHRFHIAFN